MPEAASLSVVCTASYLELLNSGICHSEADYAESPVLSCYFSRILSSLLNIKQSPYLITIISITKGPKIGPDEVKFLKKTKMLILTLRRGHAPRTPRDHRLSEHKLHSSLPAAKLQKPSEISNFEGS